MYLLAPHPNALRRELNLGCSVARDLRFLVLELAHGDLRLDFGLSLTVLVLQRWRA